MIAGAIFVASAAGFILLEMERRRRLLTRVISGKDGEAGGGRALTARKILHWLGAAASRMTMVGQKEIEQTGKTLTAAGYRSKGALYRLLGLRTVGLLLGMVGPVVWSNLFHPLAPMVLLPACIGGALLGWRAPMMVVGSMANRRRKILDADLPNAIDLLIICGEAGLSIEAGVDRIVREMKRSCPDTRPGVRDRFGGDAHPLGSDPGLRQSDRADSDRGSPLAVVHPVAGVALRNAPGQGTPRAQQGNARCPADADGGAGGTAARAHHPADDLLHSALRLHCGRRPGLHGSRQDFSKLISFKKGAFMTVFPEFVTSVVLLSVSSLVSACAGTQGGPPAPLVKPMSEEFSTIQSVDPAARTPIQLRLAEAMLGSGKAAAAAKTYQAILDREPGNVTALMGLGDAFLSSGSDDEAVDAYTKAMRADGKSALPRLGLGRAFIQLRQPEAALERFTEAVALDGADSRAKVGRGVALDLLGRHGEAISEYRTVLASQPGNRAAINNLALSLALNGQTSEAIRRLERLAQSPEAPPRVRQNLALVLGMAGRDERAAIVARIDQPPEDVASNQRFLDLIRSLVPAAAKGGEQT